METGNKNHDKNKVHRVLAHSYTVYFVFFLIGVTLDLIFGSKLFIDSNITTYGFFFLAAGSALIIWAQKTSRDLGKVEEVRSEHFFRGPYRYARSPTNWGLFLLMLGFGIISNSAFIVFFTVIAFFIARFIFVDKQERILEEKYGEHYKKYRKSIKF